MAKMSQWLRGIVAVFGPPAKPTCKVCGRPLYAAASIDRGMGPTCAGHNRKRDTATIDMFDPAGPDSFKGS